MKPTPAKPRRTPKLRFPEFRDAEGWTSMKVDDLVDTVIPPKKLLTSVYSATGKFPIIDQSQADICGWTDDSEALIHGGLPLIVFGDHTCILKFVNQPFAQGADGIKILKARPVVDTRYLYQFLCHTPVVSEEYKRHYSILKEKHIYFSDIKMGEQRIIAECLSSLDDLITVERQKLDALKAHKQGLMQQLFPRDGETRPRLRFPEFQNAPKWESMKVEELVDTVTPPKKLPTALYSAKGAFPIVDQSQDAICGWTDDLDAVLREGFPLVVFGDHTCVLKLVDQPFAQGADGIKILSARSNVDAQFLYQFLCHVPVVTEEYKRHYSILKGKPICFPDIKTGEQHRIASCLSPLDDLIAAQGAKLDALKAHKKGLMQQLLPSTEVNP